MGIYVKLKVLVQAHDKKKVPIGIGTYCANNHPNRAEEVPIGIGTYFRQGYCTSTRRNFPEPIWTAVLDVMFVAVTVASGTNVPSSVSAATTQ